jgi:hypothetical protein
MVLQLLMFSLTNVSSPEAFDENLIAERGVTSHDIVGALRCEGNGSTLPRAIILVLLIRLDNV